jgi:hypothetical protein
MTDNTLQQLMILVAELDARSHDATELISQSASAKKRAFYAGAISGYEDVRTKIIEILTHEVAVVEGHRPQ